MLANDGRKLQSVRLPGKADVEKDQIKWRVLTDNRLSGRAIVSSPNRVVRIPFEGCSRQREQCRIVIHHENALGHALHLHQLAKLSCYELNCYIMYAQKLIINWCGT
jgi:hypothetical protein